MVLFPSPFSRSLATVNTLAWLYSSPGSLNNPLGLPILSSPQAPGLTSLPPCTFRGGRALQANFNNQVLTAWGLTSEYFPQIRRLKKRLLEWEEPCPTCLSSSGPGRGEGRWRVFMLDDLGDEGGREEAVWGALG